MDGTMPNANSLPYSLSYPKSSDAIIASKNLSDGHTN